MPAMQPLSRRVGLLSVLAGLAAIVEGPDVMDGITAAMTLLGHPTAAPLVGKLVVSLALIIAYFARSAVEPHTAAAPDQTATSSPAAPPTPPVAP